MHKASLTTKLAFTFGVGGSFFLIVFLVLASPAIYGLTPFLNQAINASFGVIGLGGGLGVCSFLRHVWSDEI